MQRKKPLRRGQPPKRSTKPIRARGRPRFKGRIDRAYREYVRSQPCILRGLHDCFGFVEACHVRARGTGGYDRDNLYPGCTRAHLRQHEMGIKSFQVFYGLDLSAVAAALDAQFIRETT